MEQAARDSDPRLAPPLPPFPSRQQLKDAGPGTRPAAPVPPAQLLHLHPRARAGHPCCQLVTPPGLWCGRAGWGRGGRAAAPAGRPWRPGPAFARAGAGANKKLGRFPGRPASSLAQARHRDALRLVFSRARGGAELRPKVLRSRAPAASPRPPPAQAPFFRLEPGNPAQPRHLWTRQREHNPA